MIAQFRRLVAGLLILTLAAPFPAHAALVAPTPRSTTSASRSLLERADVQAAAACLRRRSGRGAGARGRADRRRSGAARFKHRWAARRRHRHPRRDRAGVPGAAGHRHPRLHQGVPLHQADSLNSAQFLRRTHEAGGSTSRTVGGRSRHGERRAGEEARLLRLPHAGQEDGRPVLQGRGGQVPRATRRPAKKLALKVKNGSQGVWGTIPMPPNTAVPDADIDALVKWILSQK